MSPKEFEGIADAIKSIMGDTRLRQEVRLSVVSVIVEDARRSEAGKKPL